MISYMDPMGFVFVPVTSVTMKLVEVVLAYMCIFLHSKDLKAMM